jgi:lipoyl-dependent peroxiredoxin
MNTKNHTNRIRKMRREGRQTMTKEVGRPSRTRAARSGDRPAERATDRPATPRANARRSTNLKTVHIAEMIAQGGRAGSVEAADGGFSVKLSKDGKPGSMTPEHLFAGAYGACYLGALENAIEKSHLKVKGATLVARAHLEEDSKGAYQLEVDLRASLPGLNDSDAEHVMNLAHQTCPYSKATRGNIKVNLSFD